MLSTKFRVMIEMIRSHDWWFVCDCVWMGVWLIDWLVERELGEKEVQPNLESDKN